MGNVKYTAGLIDSHAEHEDVWPASDGEGGAGATIALTCNANNKTDAASSDQYYYGEPLVIVAPAAITAAWNLIGVNIYGTTTAKELQIQLFRINYLMSDVMKVGDNDWDEGKLDPEVANDGSLFATGDKVWVRSSAHLYGEVLDVDSVAANVVTVSRETVTGGTPNGMRWDHSGDGDTETMYRCLRSANLDEHATILNYSAGSNKDFQSIRFHHTRGMHANDGLIARMLNLSDNTDATLDCAIVYELA